MIRGRIALAVAGCALAALAGCTSVVSGHGSSAQLVPGGTQRGAFGCPHVVFPAAKLSFNCISTGMTTQLGGTVWPLAEVQVVEPATNWVLEEGAGHWGAPAGQSLAAIAKTVRSRMIADDGYGAAPKVTTVLDKDTKLAGVRAHILQTTFTINPTWAISNGTTVKQEKLWIIAFQVGADDVSLWYTSVPDIVRSLWAQVPSIIATIKVG